MDNNVEVISDDTIITFDTKSTKTTVDVDKKFEYNIVHDEDPILKKVANTVDFDNDEVVEICSNLVRTAKAKRLMMLTATQCGIDLNIMVIGNEDQYVAFCNSIFEPIGDKVWSSKESCITEKYVDPMIERWYNINVEYFDFNGEQKMVGLSGITAKLFQLGHNILQGKKIVDRLSPFKRKRELEKVLKRKREINRLGKRFKNVVEK